MALLTRNKADFKKMIITLFFWEKRQNFCRKFLKIAQNCDHNIDPRLGEFSPNGWLFAFDCYVKIAEVSHIFGLLYSKVTYFYALI
jgi:hypothetical protein